MLIEFADYDDEGWPFPIMSANELSLINCPNLVIPADFEARDTISIREDEIQIMVVFDSTVLVNVTGATIPHTQASLRIGQHLSNLLEVTQLRDHPVSSMTIQAIDVFEDGLDIELSFTRVAEFLTNDLGRIQGQSWLP